MKALDSRRWTMVALALLLSAGAAGLGALELQGKERAPDGHIWSDVEGAAPVQGSYGPYTSLAPMVEQLEPTVVNIYTTQTIEAPSMPRMQRMPSPPGMQGQDELEEFFRFFGPQEQGPSERRSLGSGFVISAEGHVVTNNHVVENASEIRVRLSTGEELEARLVGADPATDIALLEVKAPRPLEFVRLGDSDELRVGDWVVAIGNPFGLSHTVTAGIVSAKQRVIGAGPYDDFIQTDASINPGNSGGPLLDMRGAVVGMNTAIVRHASGIGFAVPISEVKTVISQLVTTGKVARGWLGVGIQPLTRELARGMGLESHEGAIVSQVFPGSPADQAGLRPGDVVTQFEGKPVEDSAGLTRLVGATPPDSTATLTVVRDGKRQEVPVKLGTRGAEDAIASGKWKDDGPSKRPSEGRLGLQVAPVPPRMQEGHGEGGVLVEAVDPRGPAAKAGVRSGDIVLQVDRKPVSSPEDLQSAVSKAPSDREVVLLVRRGKSNIWVAVPPQKG